MDEGLIRRRVLLGLTGSIAAYKGAELARLLISRGYEVRVIMTQSAQEFISPLTMQSLTNNPVTTTFWEETDVPSISHIELADWADILVIAPVTADFMAKMVGGFAETPLQAVALATKAPILLAPAMNANMYEHVKTQENIEILRSRGVSFVGPDCGDLACGWNGVGRMSPPWEIFHCVQRDLSSKDFAGRKVLLTTGPTREPFDPVRVLSNRSSGKMGVALAREAFRRGADVTLIHGPVDVKVPSEVTCIKVDTALEMREEVFKHVFPKEGQTPDAVIMAAAVSDFRPKKVSPAKLKKSDGLPEIKLEKNPDILYDLGNKRGDARQPVLVGFAVETGDFDELMDEISAKIERKKVDMIVGNLAEDAFDLDTNRVWMIDKHGKREEVATTFKSRVANKILNKVLKL